jgi:transketolase
MTADLSKYTDLHVFAQAYPDRFYQMGMAEQLLISRRQGWPRGLHAVRNDLCGLRLAARLRLHHQAIAEEDLNVKIACALPGLTTGYGPSHQATEDLAIFRAMPKLVVVDPCDAHEIEQVVPAIAAHQGPVYMRLLRGNVPLVLDEYGYKFELGKAKLLRDGNDVLIISSGLMTMRALETAKALEDDKIDVACCTCRRSSRSTSRRSGANARRPVGIVDRRREPHHRRRARRGRGGRADAVGRAPTGLPQIALPDAFLDAGALPTLHDRYGISTDAMTTSIRGWM